VLETDANSFWCEVQPIVPTSAPSRRRGFSCVPDRVPQGRLAGLCLTLLALCAGTPVAGAAAGPPQLERPLRVATSPVPPFVLKDGDRLNGFSVDLWNELARRMRVQSTWTVVATHADLLETVRRGDADVAIGALVLSPQGEQLVDFSHPYFNSGLQIMVRAQNESSFRDALLAIPWATITKLFGTALLIVFVLANVLWLIERRGNPDFQRGYFLGIGEALWGTALIIATGEHGERNAPGVTKRVAVVAMWLLGVVLIAQLTATVTSSQTVQRLRSSIQGPEDLPGNVIATVPGSVAANYLTQRGLPFVGVTNGDDAISKLMQGEARAVVLGAPTLQYWVAQRGHGLVQVVGPLFHPERIGIAVPEGSPLRKRINAALDEIYEDGTYVELYARWFTPAQ
jgi:polar amino acid transport system substrate-binding protein